METTTFTDLTDVEIWVSQMLTRGAADAKSAFHWPVLCTMGTDEGEGLQGRVVVLRTFEQRTWQLLFYTDKRSQKVLHIEANAAAECVFFDPRKMIQMRAAGTASILHDGPEVDSHFATIRSEQKKDYGSSLGPGSILTDDTIAYDEQAAEENFCLVKLNIETVDWLNLNRNGHQRARLHVGERNAGEHVWLVP